MTRRGTGARPRRTCPFDGRHCSQRVTAVHRGSRCHAAAEVKDGLASCTGTLLADMSASSTVPAVDGLADGPAGGIGMRGSFAAAAAAMGGALVIGVSTSVSTITIAQGMSIGIVVTSAGITVVCNSMGVTVTMMNGINVSAAVARLRCHPRAVESSARHEVGDVSGGSRRKPAPKPPQHVLLRRGSRRTAALLSELSREPRGVGSAAAAPHHSAGPVKAVSMVRLRRQVAATRLAAQCPQGHVVVGE